MSDYDVGYGRPPKDTRFQKGQSGNPKGRRKGKKNFATTARQALRVKVPVTKNGKRVEVTVEEALFTVLTSLGLKGNLRAIERLIEVAREVDAKDEGARAERELSALEGSVLERYEARVIARYQSEAQLLEFEDGGGI